jgi:hypothetical protein
MNTIPDPAAVPAKQAKRKWIRRVLTTLAALWTLYVIIYIWCSVQGAYAPGVWGLAKKGGWRIKWWEWEPAGFYDPETGLRRWPEKFYGLLLFFDRRYWHDGMWPEPSDPRHPPTFPRLDL